MKRILIIGATSAIATACARRWAECGSALFLVGRNAQRMEQLGRDLIARGATQVVCHVLDLSHLEEHAAMLSRCQSALGSVDITLIAHGTLPDQLACERDAALTVSEMSNNALSTIALLGQIANLMEARKQGCIAVISSVAGDRGRRSNYVYGAAKAAVTAFSSGLRSRLLKAGVHVLTIKPGFVDTPMTAQLDLPRGLVVSADQVAGSILRAIDRQSNVLYTPWFWAAVMLAIRTIPESIFKRIGF